MGLEFGEVTKYHLCNFYSPVFSVSSLLLSSLYGRLSICDEDE